MTSRSLRKRQILLPQGSENKFITKLAKNTFRSSHTHNKKMSTSNVREMDCIIKNKSKPKILMDTIKKKND